MKNRRGTLALIAAAMLVVAAFGFTQLRAAARGWDPANTTLEIGVSRDGAVHFELTLTNRGDRDAMFNFTSGQQHEFIVMRKTGVTWTRIWRWSEDMMFTEALTQITLAPGESHTFTGSWEPGEPGEYRVTGTLTERYTKLEAQAGFVIE